MLIAFFLTDAELIVSSRDGMMDEVRLRLPDPDGVLVGITVKKKTELRDRLSKILEQRESEPPKQRKRSGPEWIFSLLSGPPSLRPGTNGRNTPLSPPP